MGGNLYAETTTTTTEATPTPAAPETKTEPAPLLPESEELMTAGLTNLANDLAPMLTGLYAADAELRRLYVVERISSEAGKQARDSVRTLMSSISVAAAKIAAHFEDPTAPKQ